MSNDTQSKAFILSYSEVMKYIPDWHDRLVTGTNHWWWLRSIGSDPRRAASVGEDGAFYSNSMRIENGVRPALWVNNTGIIGYGKNIEIDGIKFKILAIEDSKALLISKETLFNAQYIETKQWGVPYISYQEQVGRHYTGSIRKAIDDWFSSLPKNGYLRTNAIQPLTLECEQNFKEINECAISHPLHVIPDDSDVPSTHEIKHPSLIDEVRQACKSSAEMSYGSESSLFDMQRER
ncbi:MAG: DUF6273 domain-containing protein [Oscillospiraceae bacterium]|nr:DUF6273 domain-containing protein [Oscillospiraceae bacterium]